ncbi:RNA polymerase sigma factor [Spirosoma aureum]|uniref:RNA polymerase sigma factor n=1 Tax=Spirosoma aureum TaxID=2692134 RepID=A0A6G9ANN8_9BACT|nr:RNA polymerase sigma factor [Spirosoma aureum]QIP13823.1 RNA polymerase sigma factor [Spirosoma aureum]
MKIDQLTLITGDDYWVQQHRMGNQLGMSILYQRYYPKVYNKCLSLCQDSDLAFDLAQDILLKAFDHLHSFRELSSFSTWLYTITYNHYREFFRNSKRLPISQLNENHEGSAGDFAMTFEESTSQQDPAESRMLALLSSISETDRTMLYLKYRDGQSIEHIQARFMLSASAVKMRLKRARTKLNKLYAKQPY